MQGARRKVDEDVHYFISAPVDQAASIDAFYDGLIEAFQVPRRDVSRPYAIRDIAMRNDMGICIGVKRQEAGAERWLFIAVDYKSAQSVDEIAQMHDISFADDPIAISVRPEPPRYRSRPRV
jgi:hypothetical protein